MFNLDESAMLNSNTGAAAAALDSIVRVCRRQARKSIDRNMVPYYQYVLVGCYVEAIADWLDGQDQPLARSSTAPLLLPKSLPFTTSQPQPTFHYILCSSFQQPCIQYTYKIISENATLCINRPSWLTHFTSNRCNVNKISINNS